jgi:hypothetical protein
VMELLGVGGILLSILLEGGISTDDIVKMALDALIVAIPIALVAILIEKLVSMIVPAAGAVLAVIEGLQAAWGTISRIIAAFGAFMAFLLAVQGGGAGPLFATALAAAAIVLLDFVSNWLLKKLAGPAKKVGARLKGMGDKLKGKGKGKGPKSGKPKKKAKDDGPDGPSAKGKPGSSKGKPDAKKPAKDKKKDPKKKEKDKKKKDDKAAAQKAARAAAKRGWSQAKSASARHVVSTGEMQSLLARAAQSTPKARIHLEVKHAGEGWSVEADAHVGKAKASATTGKGWVAKGNSGQRFYAATNLTSFNKKLIEDAYRELNSGGGKTKGKPAAGAGKSLQDQYSAKVAEGERVEKKQQGRLDSKIKGLRFTVTMEPFAQVERDKKIKTHFEVAPNTTEDDKDIKLDDDDLDQAAHDAGQELANKKVDEALLCKVLKDPIAAALPGHAKAKESVEKELATALTKDESFKDAVKPSREQAVKDASTAGFADFAETTLEPSSGLANHLRTELKKRVSGGEATGPEKHAGGVIKRYAGVSVVYDEMADDKATLDKIKRDLADEAQRELTAFCDKHKVTDGGRRGELKEYFDMGLEDSIKKQPGYLRAETLRKLVADADIKATLERMCKDAWTESCNKWVESVVESAWNPRKDLIDWAIMAIYPKHLKGTTDKDAQSIASTGDGQYWPKSGCEFRVRDTLLTGDWKRVGTTVHAFKEYGENIGFDGGTGTATGRHRAELTQATPPQMHGHPKINWSDG